MFASPTKSENLAFESFIPPFLNQSNTALYILTVISGVGCRQKKVCNCVARTAPFTYLKMTHRPTENPNKTNDGHRRPAKTLLICRKFLDNVIEQIWHNIMDIVWRSTLMVPVVVWKPLKFWNKCVCVVQIIEHFDKPKKYAFAVWRPSQSLHIFSGIIYLSVYL